MDGDSGKEETRDHARRDFLKATVVASAVIAIGGVAAVAKPFLIPGSGSGISGFPRYQIVDSNNNSITVDSLDVNQPLFFNYPLDNEPNMLVKLGVPAENGVGPDGDIVAFSALCQHLGCTPGYVAQGQSPPCNSSYKAPGPEMYCCCHGSKYDLLKKASIIQPSPTQFPVPQVILEVDSAGNLFATGMGPPTIYRHGTPGSDDVSQDLTGGSPV